MKSGMIAIIGGSGVRDSPLFKDVPYVTSDTFYSNGFGDGKVEYQITDDVIFIPRHGNTKTYSPSRTQYGANLIAAKILGAKVVIATSAVGSLKPEEIKEESLVVPDDFIDESGRDDNLFCKGLIVHTNPRPGFSALLRLILTSAADKTPGCFNKVHTHGTYVTIPGDRFGTSAEGKKRAQYADVVGMTICPEASMALQLGLPYAVAAFPVDVDTDANHEHKTLEVMKRLSDPERVPAFIERVVETTKKYLHEFNGLTNLVGNIIPGDISRIENILLREVAKELIATYCK